MWYSTILLWYYIINNSKHYILFSLLILHILDGKQYVKHTFIESKVLHNNTITLENR